MVRKTPDKNSKQLVEPPTELHSDMRDEVADHKTDTNWDEWAKKEQEWRRAGGEQAPGKTEEEDA